MRLLKHFVHEGSRLNPNRKQGFRIQQPSNTKIVLGDPRQVRRCLQNTDPKSPPTTTHPSPHTPPSRSHEATKPLLLEHLRGLLHQLVHPPDLHLLVLRICGWVWCNRLRASREPHGKRCVWVCVCVCVCVRSDRMPCHHPFGFAAGACGTLILPHAMKLWVRVGSKA